MEKRRKFTREFKLEAVRLIRERGVSYGHIVRARQAYSNRRPANQPTTRMAASRQRFACLACAPIAVPPEQKFHGVIGSWFLGRLGVLPVEHPDTQFWLSSTN